MILQLVDRVDDDLVAAFARLVPQLTRNHPPPDRAALERLIRSDCATLIVARADPAAPILGALTLIVYPVPTGLRARIEDVVVDESARGQGIGEALTRHALELARQAGADGVALTSSPRREAANRLYQRIGFKRWETNLYFYEFSERR